MFDFLTRKTTTHRPEETGSGHGGGDDALSECFIDAVVTSDQSRLGVTAEEVLNTHLVVFAAEQSRMERRTIDFSSFKATAMG